MILVSFLWFLVVMSSPWLVEIYKDQFTVYGWLAIGNYDFDLQDGIKRSLYFFVITLPTMLVIYKFRPKKLVTNNISLKFKVSPLVIVMLMVFCCIALKFLLGMNGVETNAPFKLSGIVYYLRAYVFTLILGVYCFQERKPSTSLVILYALIAGFTSASRFIAVIPIILLLVRHFFENNNQLKIKGFFLILCIFLSYFIITFARLPFYEEDFVLEDYFKILISNWESIITVGINGFSQLILRLGLGRDVILAYEVMENGVCNSFEGLFFLAGSCRDAAYDFYGLVLNSHKFYLGNPQFSSLIAVSSNPLVAFLISIAYAMNTALILLPLKYLSKQANFLALFSVPIYILLIIFICIGPIKFAWYCFCLILFTLFNLKLLKFSRNRLRQRASMDN